MNVHLSKYSKEYIATQTVGKKKHGIGESFCGFGMTYIEAIQNCIEAISTLRK